MTLMPETQFSLLTHFCAGQSNSTYFKAFEVSTLIFVLCEKKEFRQKMVSTFSTSWRILKKKNRKDNEKLCSSFKKRILKKKKKTSYEKNHIKWPWHFWIYVPASMGYICMNLINTLCIYIQWKRMRKEQSYQMQNLMKHQKRTYF